MNYKFKKATLLIGDILVLYLSLYLTLLLRYFELPARSTWDIHFWPFSLAFIAWILIFYISDLYNLHIAVNNSKFFNLTLRSAGIAGLLTAVFFYINPSINIAPKTNLVIYIFIFTVLFMLWRRLFNALLHSYLAKDNLAFIGYNGKVMALIKALQEKPHLGYRVSLIINKGITDGLSKITTTNDIANLKKYIIDKNITTIILATDLHESSELRSSLFDCLPLKINFINLPNFYENVTGKVPIDAISKMWFLENLSEGRKIVFDTFKRTYDIFLAFSILLITFPFWPLIGLLLKIENKEPIFFIQKRAGQNNKQFRLIKFRTQRTVDKNPAPSQKNDLRTTKFGNILRITRIDEIPQIINIIIGQMSFVGPRPERPELIQELEKEVPFYRERMLVKPGLTGWDQVSGEYHSPSREDTLKKLQYDLFYIKNRSLYLDLSIILKTIATVLKGGGV